ncbi:MAG: hypothetical protein IJ367_02900, partial [Clostridia bacterium]|nr:hypothetical protein [Clostridia bacterium]
MKEKLSAHSGIIALILVIILAIVGCVFGFMRIFEERARNKELMAISESAAQEEPFEKGIVSEAGYESKYLNLRFTPPEGFVMCTDAEVSKTFPGMEDIAEMGTVSANGESIYFFAEDLPEENADV